MTIEHVYNYSVNNPTKLITPLASTHPMGASSQYNSMTGCLLQDMGCPDRRHCHTRAAHVSHLQLTVFSAQACFTLHRMHTPE